MKKAVVLLMQVLSLGMANADFKRVPFLKSKIKGEKVTINVFSNAESRKYFTSGFIDGAVNAGVHVRFSNKQEGVFVLDPKLGKVKLVCSDLNRYSYFTKASSKGGAYLRMPTDLTVDKDGKMVVVDNVDSYLMSIDLDVASKTYTASNAKSVYIVEEQDFQVRYVTHVNDGGTKLILAMNDLGNIHVLNYDLTPVLNDRGAPLVHTIQYPGKVFKKLKTDHLIENNVATFYTLTRPPDSIPGKGFPQDGWMELKYNVVQKAFISERFVETGPTYFNNFADLFPFYIKTQTGNPIMHMLILDDMGGFHEFREDGQLVKTIASGLDETDPRLLKQNPEIKDPVAITSCNDRRNFDLCRNVVIVENIQVPGNGLVRYQFAPNPGDEYFIPLDIKVRENNTNGNANEPDVLISNLSAIDVLSDFTVRLWMSKEEFPTQTLGADKYYFNPDSIQMKTGVHPQNPNIVYVDLTFPPSFELLPNQTTTERGMHFGAHFKNYWPGAWNRSNDWSWNGISNVYSSTKNITVYNDEGRLIYGIEPNPGSTPQPPSPITSEVLGFEDPTQWNAPSAVLSSSTTRTQGSYSMSVSGGGWFVVNSAYMKTQDISGETSRLAVDVFVPGSQPNPWWLGSVALVANCISGGIQNSYLGQVELTPLPQGSFSTVTFNIPSNVLTALQGGFEDFALRFEINVNAGAPPLRLDNLRFVP